MMTRDERQQILAEWRTTVNLNPRELQDWLKTEEARSVGQKDDEDSESTGHASGRRIVGLLQKNRSELTDDDLEHMRKVTGYVHRHMAQRPSGDVSETRWRYSLMNWGHDPLKH
jgi:hypothetical protein